MSNANDHGDKKPETVSIHLNGNEVKSPIPTTGAALYVLGNIDAEKYDLYLEVKGKGDDTLIPNDSQEVTLKNGDHLYTTQKDLNPGC